MKTYEVDETIRAGVLASLPMISEIQDEDLRNKVLDAWAISLKENGFTKLEEVDGPLDVTMYCSQPKHMMAVAKMALHAAECFNEVLEEPLNIDRDLLLACALCHDLGNPYENNVQKRAKWNEDPSAEGSPCLRHTFYGAHIALTVGLPEAVAHACACHSKEGRFVRRSDITSVLYYVDDAFWGVIKNAHGITT